MNTEVPLIWTAKGNLPFDDLYCEVRWEDTKDYIKFTEIYKLKTTDEVVRDSHHTYLKQGLPVFGEQGALNG